MRYIYIYLLFMNKSSLSFFFFSSCFLSSTHVPHSSHLCLHFFLFSLSLSLSHKHTHSRMPPHPLYCYSLSSPPPRKCGLVTQMVRLVFLFFFFGYNLISYIYERMCFVFVLIVYP